MEKITKEYAHVVGDENLFVHEVARLAPHKFESEFTIDGTHAYLFSIRAGSY